ncbi:MAG: 1-acyl-sn-glycerol-3-phosphate acyltransferase [Deltaproteobacteria bacterium]|nr:1-acyl-sn-glycerol-3-phosphate acyltransferase [Deltaproteobacteria bacterium]
MIHLLLRRSLAFFRHLMSFLGLVRFRIRGDLPKGPFVLVSNHPTLIDAPLLLGLIPNATCIVKNSLERSWSYHVAIEELGYIPNGESQHFIERCIDAVRGGRPLLIFPEGTRSDSLRSFERGAATIALRAGVPLLAAVLTCDPPMLGKGSRWHEVPPRSVDFTISIEYPQFFAQNESVTSVSDASEISLQRGQSIRMTAELENFYRERLANE